MMNIGLNVHLKDERFRYHIHEIVSAFYDAETVVYTCDDVAEENDQLFVNISEIEEDFKINIELYCGEKRVNREFTVSQTVKFADDTDAPALNRARRFLKAELYELFSQTLERKIPWGSMTGIRPAKVVNKLMKLGLSEEDILTELKSRYSVSDSKAKLALEVAATQAEILKNTAPNAISLYIGIPFCPSRCLYCSFTSNPIGKYKKYVCEYLDALTFEMNETAKLLEEADFTVESIYIGGGTPTSLEAPDLDRLLEAVNLIWTPEKYNIKEFCVEAGRPDSINTDKLKVMKARGVTRISINPQTLSDKTLEIIGRKHSREEFFKSFNMAREEGFDNINVDIIAGLPGEDCSMFEKTVDGILKLSPENITVHTMSIKRASELKMYKGEYLLTESQSVEKMISYAYGNITLNGLNPFYMYRQKNMLGNLENVSYSKLGFESSYNIHIMEEDQTILAFGAGAVSKFVCGEVIERAFNVKSVEDYLKRKEEMIDRKRIFVYNYLVKYRVRK